MKNRVLLIVSGVLTLLFGWGAFFFINQLVAEDASPTRIVLTLAAMAICCFLYLVFFVGFLVKLNDLYQKN